MLRPMVTILVFFAAWWVVARFAGIPPYMLPNPRSVAQALVAQRGILFWNTLTTLGEILLGLIFGTLLGAVSALGIVVSPALQR